MPIDDHMGHTKSDNPGLHKPICESIWKLKPLSDNIAQAIRGESL